MLKFLSIVFYVFCLISIVIITLITFVLKTNYGYEIYFSIAIIALCLKLWIFCLEKKNQNKNDK